MTATRLNSFWGMIPIMDQRLLPQGAAAYAENVRATGGNLRGYRPDLLVHTCLSTTTKNVYRIPNTIGEGLATTFGNSTWMEFASQYVDVLRTNVVDDQYERYYWASPDFSPQYNTKARIQAGQPSFLLGVPPPSHAPAIVVDGGAITYTYSVAGGSLPTGLTLNGSTGQLTGTPSAIGVFTFTIKVVDNEGNTGVLDYTLTVDQSGLVSIYPTALDSGTVGSAYVTTNLTPLGGSAPYTMVLQSGSLPPGVSLNLTTGAFSGTPTQAGDYAFTIRATDTNGLICDTAYSINIANIGSGIVVYPTNLVDGQQNTSYYGTISASGGSTSYTYSIVSGALPPGLSLDSLSGTISGTATSPGDYTFIARATSGSGYADRWFEVSIASQPFTLWPSNFAPCVNGQPYSQLVQASGGASPYTYSVSTGTLPTGLSLNPVTGEVSGTATTDGSYTFTVQAVDAHGASVSHSYTVVVGLTALNLLPVALPDGVQGSPYSQTFSVDTTEIITVTRAYLTTWVTAYGEEGPAGVPSAATTGRVGGSWALTLTPPSPSESANRNLATVRLYRTITASTGQAVFYLVDELPISTTTYADTADDATVAGNSQLQSTTWVGPPTTLQGMVAMPNGIFAGWTGNDIYFTEPYHPHAWPAEYALTVDYPIIGLGVFGQSLVVLTTGNPVVITGLDPSMMQQAKSQSFEPCLARSSIVSAPNGVTYASPNGLVFVSSGVVQSLSDSAVDKEMWLTQIVPSTLCAAYYRGGYVAMNGPRSGAGGGFYIGVNELGFNAYIGQIKQVGFNWVTSQGNIQNLITDPWTGEILQIYDVGGVRGVYRFDPSDQTVGMNSYIWKSPIFQLPKKDNLGACKLVYEIPAGLTGTDQYVTLQVWADSKLRMTKTVMKSGDIFHLPSGFKAEFWQFQVTSKVILHSLEIAGSFRELASV